MSKKLDLGRISEIWYKFLFNEVNSQFLFQCTILKANFDKKCALKRVFSENFSQ